MRRAMKAALAIAAASMLGFMASQAFGAPGGGGPMPRPDMPRPSPSPSKPPKDKEPQTDFQKAEYLIKAEKYEEAIPLLQSVVALDARDADAWNYLGFASRKLGNLIEAQGYYDRALKIRPDHKGANEYLGELYLMMNDLAKAEAQLAKLKSLCPSGCEELEDLEDDIAAYRSNHPTQAAAPAG